MNLEEHFRNKLKNHQVDWDKDSLLDGLKQGLDQDKRRFDWRWSLLLLLFLVLGYWGWNDYSTSSTIDVSEIELNEKLIHNEKINTDTKNYSGIESGKKQNKIASESNNSNAVAEIKTEVKHPSSNVIEDSKAEDIKPYTGPEDVVLKKEITSGSVSSIVINEAATNVDFKSYSQSASQELNKSEESDGDVNTNEITTVGPVVTTNQKLGQAETISEFSESNDGIVLNIAENETQSITSENDLTVVAGAVVGGAIVGDENDLVPFTEIATLGEKELKLLNEEWSVPFMDLSIVDPSIEDIVIVEKEQSAEALFVSLSGDVGVISRNRSYDTSNADFIDRLQANEKTENALILLNSNIGIGYRLSDKWSIESGLAYSEIKEVFNLEIENKEEYNRLEEGYRYIIVDGADTTFVRDTVTVLKTTTRTIKHYNSHKFFSIPLQVGYHFNVKELEFIGSVGLSYAFAYNYEGRRNHIYENGESNILYPNGQNAEVDFGFELKDRLGLQLGLEMVYPFMSQHQVFVNANYRRSPTLGYSVFEQNYNSISLGAGLRFVFGD